LYKHLRRQGEKYDKHRNGKSTQGQIKNKININNRPKIVGNKKRVGEWKIDILISKNHLDTIVTVVEREALFTVAALVDCKQADVVTTPTIQLLTPLKGCVHKITADNGKQFAYHEKPIKELGTKLFFCAPLQLLGARFK
jgi:IS30 family transposase